MNNSFFLKGVLLLFVVLIGQILIAHRIVAPNDEIRLLDYYMQNHFNVVYFGDSSLDWTSQEDASQVGMSGMLQLRLPKAKIAKIAHESYHLEVFAAFVDYLVRKKYHPQYVIVPINLRSFSPEWDLQPLWQFEKEKYIAKYKDTLGMAFYQPLGVFKYFESPISRYAYEQSAVYNGMQYIGKIKDFDNPGFHVVSDENMKKKLMFRYMYALKEDHRKVKAMLKIASQLKEVGIEVVFYISPIDVQTAEKYLGPEFLQRKNENINLIKTLLVHRGVEVLDLSGVLGTRYFTWHGEGDKALYPNEHLKQLGRMMVVKLLVERFFLGEYRP